VIGPLTAGIVAVGVSLFSGYAHPWLLLVFVIVWCGMQDYAVSIHPALVIAEAPALG